MSVNVTQMVFEVLAELEANALRERDDREEADYLHDAALDAEDAFLELFDNLDAAWDFEAQLLSVGGEFLTPEAIKVRDQDESTTPEERATYFRWAAEQAVKAQQ